MTSPNPTTYFWPWIQARASAGLAVDTANSPSAVPGAATAPQPLQLGVTLINTMPGAVDDPDVPQPIRSPSNNIRLLGPGDVVGVDPAQILRRFPAPDSGGLTNDVTNMAYIEFAATDLPWRFSPVTAIADPPNARLRPWLALIVVEVSDGDVVMNTGSPCPLISVPTEHLPDLNQSWAWAHAQLDGDDSNPSAGRSRLLCPRQLPENSVMRAVLVPTFVGGVLAADPDPVKRQQAASSTDAHQPAWDIAQAGRVTLPVYDWWTFRTGNDVDFEGLARRLQPLTGAAATALSGRPIDIGYPFPARDGGNTSRVVTMGAALVPITADVGAADPTPVADDVAACATEVAKAINTAATDLQMGPPLRGGPQAGRPTIVPTGNGDWLDEANRDPRHRLAAARGADWVNAHQEELMAQAWTQAGPIRAAAARLAVARAAVAVTERLHSRHVTPLTLDEQIALTAPAAQRLRVPGLAPAATATTPSLADLMSAAAAPNGLGSTTFARLVRTRALAPRAASSALTSKAMAGQLIGFPGVRTAPSSPVTTTIQSNAGPAIVAAQQLLIDTTSEATATAMWHGRQSAVTTLAQVLEPHFQVTTAPSAGSGGGATVLAVPAATAATIWQGAFAPGNAVQRRIASMVSPATEQLQPILPTPTVGSPLALGLIERDPTWLVAGASQFPDDRVTLLRPDPAFIESVLLGANQAMLDEYLWRGFPTDRRGTPIRQFWPTHTDDIAAIDGWPKGSHLGSHLAGIGIGNLTFLMLRSELFERYPETIVAAAWPTGSGAPNLSEDGMIAPVMPMLCINSRTRLVGFPISHTAVTINPGCYFLLIEPPTSPRFGWENWKAVTPTAVTPRGFLDAVALMGPANASSAQLASGSLRQTVRVIMHSTRLADTQ
jgi:hypothetical protein